MSVVYFIRSAATGAIKIGVTKTLASRLRSLRNGNPSHLTVLATIPGGHDDEKRLHRLFAPSRMVREWFAPDEPLLNFISRLGSASLVEIEEFAAAEMAEWLARTKAQAKQRALLIDAAIRHGMASVIERDGIAAVCSRYGCNEKTARRWKNKTSLPGTALGMTVICDCPEMFERLWLILGVRPQAMDGLRERLKVRAA